jgi:hypothetical protein
MQSSGARQVTDSFSADRFDGSMMNGLQSVKAWRSYFGEPKGATLGLFNAAYPIGGLLAIPLISFVCDGVGRRDGLAVGATVCVPSSYEGPGLFSSIFYVFHAARHIGLPRWT